MIVYCPRCGQLWLALNPEEAARHKQLCRVCRDDGLSPEHRRRLKEKIERRLKVAWTEEDFIVSVMGAVLNPVFTI